MSVHEQYADDLALLALGALEGEERAGLEKHLETCASCRRELEQLRGDMALLAMSTAGPKPPARARQRLLAAIAAEPVHPTQAEAKQPTWWSIAGWALAAAVAIVAGVFWQQSQSLQRQVADLGGQLRNQQAELQKAREMVAVLTKPDAAFTVVKTNTPPQPQGKAFYKRDQARLMFMANNLPRLPERKAYELWLLPANGAAPIPAGVFKPDARGNAMVIDPPLPNGVEPKAFAMTIEPEEGSATPTMPIVMMGAGE